VIHSRSEEYMPEEAIYLPVVSFDSVLKKKKKSDSNSLTLKRNLLAHLIKKNESTPASLRTCSLSSSLS